MDLERREVMVSKRVEEYCRTAKMTIASFEKRCGLGNGTVSKWRHGAHPTVTTLLKMEKVTGIPLYMWIEEDVR